MKTTDSAELRDNYLALSLQYERLAAILEKAEPAAKPGESLRRQFLTDTWIRGRRPPSKRPTAISDIG